MSFPVSGSLDNFDRASLGANWTTGFFGDTAPVISASQLQAPALGGWAGARWNVATYGPNCEAYITAVDQPAAGRALWVRVGGTDASPNGYQFVFSNTAFCNINSVSAGSTTKLGADFTITGFAANSKVGIEASGNTLTVYHMASSASVWSSVTSRTDSTWSSAGYLAWEGFEPGLNDNFGGGTIINAYTETGAGVAGGNAAGEGYWLGDAFESTAFQNDAFQTTAGSGGTTYNETGAGVAGAVAAGTYAFAAADSGAGIAGGVASGADARTTFDTGAGIAGAVAAGADNLTYSDTGAGIAGGISAGADVVTVTESGYGLAGAEASGAEQFTGAGGTTYNETGAGVAGAVAAVLDVMTLVESGVSVAGAVSSGADGWTMSDTGAGVVGALGAGAYAYAMPESGAGLLGAIASGADVLSMSDSGYGLAGAVASGYDSVATAGDAAHSDPVRQAGAAVSQDEIIARAFAGRVGQAGATVRGRGSKVA